MEMVQFFLGHFLEHKNLVYLLHCSLQRPDLASHILSVRPTHDGCGKHPAGAAAQRHSWQLGKWQELNVQTTLEVMTRHSHAGISMMIKKHWLLILLLINVLLIDAWIITSQIPNSKIPASLSQFEQVQIEAHAGMANAHVYGDVQAAMEALSRARAVAPDAAKHPDVIAVGKLIGRRLFTDAMAARSNGDLTSVELLLSQALQSDPDNQIYALEHQKIQDHIENPE